MTGSFDGHANCFVESGDGKALLIDFNYDTEPLPGQVPGARRRPVHSARGDHANHWGKLAFRWIYWNLLLPAAPSRAGAHVDGRQTRPDQGGVTPCPSPRSPGTTIHVDDEGFLTDYDEWDEDLAKQLAAQIGIDLTDAHWKAIRFLRDGLRHPGRDGDPAAGLRRGRDPDQGAVHAVPQEAGQEDGLHRRSAQAARLRVKESNA